MCYIACPEKCTEELCPKCLFVWTIKHELTLVLQTKYLVSDECTQCSLLGPVSAPQLSIAWSKSPGNVHLYFLFVVSSCVYCFYEDVNTILSCKLGHVKRVSIKESINSRNQSKLLNKIISYGTRDSEHPIRTAATRRREHMTGRFPLALGGSGSFEASEPKGLVHAINNPPSFVLFTSESDLWSVIFGLLSLVLICIFPGDLYLSNQSRGQGLCSFKPDVNSRKKYK